MKQGRLHTALFGVAAAAAIGLGSLVMSSRYARDMYAMLLVFTAAVDVGAALSQANSQTLLASFTVASLFFSLALLGRWIGLEFLIAGYLAHAFLDGLHGLRAVRTSVKTWWPPFCFCFDVTLAGLMYVRWVHA